MRATHRLRHSDDFRFTTRTGVKAARSHVMVHLAVADSPQMPRRQREPRVGFVVSKKVGNSVVRHRVKRRLRAIAGEQIDRLPEYSTVVVRTMPGTAALSFHDLGAEVVQALSAAVSTWEKKRGPRK